MKILFETKDTTEVVQFLRTVTRSGDELPDGVIVQTNQRVVFVPEADFAEGVRS